MSRFRRLRKSAAIRNLVKETQLNKDDVIQPFFVSEEKKGKKEIASMPGIYRYSESELIKAVEVYIKKGGQAGLFFGVPKNKYADAKNAYDENGVVQKAVRSLKKSFPDFYVMTDVCLCSYTDHGHCGIIKNNAVDNDETVDILGRVAVSHAAAGADMVAPSDMMDLRVAQIRDDLDQHNLTETAIMSYAAKYQSAFYGPFRDAADSAPQFGDRKSYQMDPANQIEALKEAEQDIREGTDVIMVKPAMAYQDIIYIIKQSVTVPVAAYQVSGEFSMIRAAAHKKWIDEKDVALESLVSIKRAGADMIVTYYAQEVLNWINK